MKIRLLTFFYILTSSILMAQAPKGTLSLEDHDFNNYFLNTDKLPTIKGKVLHLSYNDIGKMKITYWIITPFNQSSVSKVKDINVDGTFELELDYGFPYQQVFIMMDKYFYGSVYINSDLFIELDMDILNKKPVSINGKGVRFMGKDGELTSFMNNHVLFEKEQQPDLSRKSLELTNKKELSFEEFKVQFDSLYIELNKLDKKYTNKKPSKYAWLIYNERKSDYYAGILSWHHGKLINKELWKEILNHKGYIVSNSSNYFYNKVIAYAEVNATNHFSFIGYEPVEKIITKRTILYLDSCFEPAKADFLKLRIGSKELKEQKNMFELVLASMRIEWCKVVLNNEYQKTLKKVNNVNKILETSQSSGSANSIGQIIMEMPFGARLYKVNNSKASDLLANLKATFKDKALLIDFWGTFCAPCIREMPYSKKLHEETKDLAVEFVYLCTSSSSNIDTWKNKIAELEVPGTHIFVEETIENELMSFFSVSGFPSVVFISRDGVYQPGIIRYMSETDKDKLTKLINK